jgi:CubicO group peptidase (beta-lactamase class C family)
MVAPVMALVVTGLLAIGCTGGGDEAGETEGAGRVTLPDGSTPTYPTLLFSELDERLRDRIVGAELAGGVIAVEQDGARLHTFADGALDETTPVPLAETGMWLTAATLMTLVEEGRLELDAPVGEHLPTLVGDPGTVTAGDVTLRQLLSHTSGLPATVDCGGPGGCDAAVASTERLGDAGEVFAISPVGYHVAARLAETVLDRPWDEIVAERLLSPLATTATGFTSPPVDPPTDPDSGPVLRALLAADGTTTVADLGRFMAMILAKGETAEGRILEAASVEEMERDQTPSLDTSGEEWVAATGVPTYGLGVWRDRLRGDGTALASAVSAPNRWGLYPVVDRPRSAWGIVAVVEDPLVPLEAVRDSATLAQLFGVAIDSEGRPLRRPGSPIGG